MTLRIIPERRATLGALLAAMLLSSALALAQGEARASMPAPGSPEAAAQYEPLPVPSPDELLAQGRMAVFARDYADALRLFRQAATAGSARALSAIGDLHERGFGVARSDREATVWYR